MQCLSHARRSGIKSSLWKATWRERLRLLWTGRIEVSTGASSFRVEVAARQSARPLRRPSFFRNHP